MRKLLLAVFFLSAFVVNAQEKKEEELVELKDVSFSIIEKVPIYSGCKGDNKALKKCFNKSIQMHIAKNFDSNLPNSLGLIAGKKRITMMFRINKNGVVDNVRVKAPHPKLQKECERILKLLPKFYPGEQKGKPVGVKYTLPMRIDVQGQDKDN
jgi:protein TonB